MVLVLLVLGGVYVIWFCDVLFCGIFVESSWWYVALVLFGGDCGYFGFGFVVMGYCWGFDCVFYSLLVLGLTCCWVYYVGAFCGWLRNEFSCSVDFIVLGLVTLMCDVGLLRRFLVAVACSVFFVLFWRRLPQG